MSDPIEFEGATPRFSLPLLFAGQAQKEFFVNEALLRADLVLHGAIEGETQTPPSAPAIGQAWLVGPAPTGVFAGRPGVIAGWTGDGWRFVEPRDGLRVFDRGAQAFRLYSGGWRFAATPAAPSGGATVDAEARATIVSILERLADAGVFAAS
ncbi:MAG TPA: DUF2793 domain-containing protein [Novosphingobium sp.]|nr:DUF2793 domain-containing protein [Novosphingobium sp.]